MRRPWDKIADGDYAHQRAVRTMQKILRRIRAGWVRGELRWNDAKWGLIGMADLVREELGVEVRMLMPESIGGVYVAQVQVGDPPGPNWSIVERFAAGNEAKPPAGGDKDIALSFYNCEPVA